MKKLLCTLLAVLTMLVGTSVLAEQVDMTAPMDIELMAYFVMEVNENDPLIKYINEKFNVTLKPTITSEANYKDTLNMRIAGGSLPDWFRVTDQGVFNQLVEDKKLLNVSEMVEKYGFENIAAQLEVNGKASFLANDGVFYRIPDTLGSLNRSIYYRLDWLKALGLEEPTTWEEFADMCRAFAAADLDGIDSTGYASYGDIAGMEMAQSAFTGYRNWGITSDGEYIYKFEDDNFKAMIKFWSELYAEEGTLDPEILISSSTDSIEKFCTGKVGALMMNVNSTWFSSINSTLKAYKPDAELGLMVTMPAGPAGAYMNTYFGFSADSAFNGSMSEAKAARILAIYDYLLSEEGRELTLYGFEGQHHDVVNGVKVQREATLNAEWGQLQHLLGEVADFGTNDRLITEPTMIKWVEATSNPENVRADLLGYFSNERASVINSSLNAVKTKYLVPMVSGEMDVDAEWDNFQQAMKDAGIDEYREMVKAYYESKNATPDAATF